MMSLAATVFAKFDTVIVCTFGEDAGLVKTTSLSFADRLVVTTSSDTFFESSAIIYQVLTCQGGKYYR